MNQLKSILKKIPFLTQAYRAVKSAHRNRKNRAASTESIFTEIYQNNAWQGAESVSGTGSDSDQIKVLLAEIPRVLNELNVKSMLDIPCGDFHWMKDVDLAGVDYVGADIVPALVAQNEARFAGPGCRFAKVDLISDPLPDVELVFCRDCLVHLSNDKVHAALDNIAASGAKYLMATTFTDRAENVDIVTGDWRALNLEIAPFNLGKPLMMIDEQCTEHNGAFRDKALGLWKIEALRSSRGG